MKRLLPLLTLSALLCAAAPVLRAADAPPPRARINHVAFYVRDLKVSTDFYRDLIGLEMIPEPFKDGRHSWFLIGPQTQLHIISGATETLPKIKNAHLCFTVPSVDEFTARLKKANLPFENLAGQKMSVTLRPDGVKQIYFQDPDGYWLEINDAKG